MERPLALVVDGDAAVRRRVQHILSEKDIEVVEASTGDGALEEIERRPVGVLLVDQHVPGAAASDIVKEASRRRPLCVSVVVAVDDVAALEAVRGGAYDALVRPLDSARLEVALTKAVDRHAMLADNEELRRRLREQSGLPQLVGRSVAVEHLRERLERQAALDSPLCLVGEDGVGRRWAARFVHEHSTRSERPFLAVDCRTRPDDALERELFGAPEAAGILENAGTGSVFLDEVVELPPRIQEQLLQTMLRGFVARSGSSEQNAVRARLLSSTHRDLSQAARDGRLREDLAERLSTGVVQIPALRDRPEDIIPLARYFIDVVCELNQLPPYRLDPEVAELLEGHAWPGNVRELRNAIEHAVILARDDTIRAGDLPEPVRGASPAGNRVADLSGRTFKAAKREVVETFERRYLVDLMQTHGGNVTAAAQKAGMLRSALQRLLRKYDIRSADFRRPSAKKAPEDRA